MSQLFRTTGIAILAAGSAAAQTPSTGDRVRAAVDLAQGAGEEGVRLLDMLDKGGIMMWPLGALSFIAVILILLYTFTLRAGAVINQGFMDLAETLLRRGDHLALVAACNRSNLAVARIMQRAMDFATRSQSVTVEEVREVAEAEGTRQASMLSQRISYLADVGSIAPMVGLLGTVLGMIKAFNTLSGGAFVGAKTMKLAEGVSEALITTAAGLFIGIPALAFYAVFRGRVQKLISEMEAATTHLMALFASETAAEARAHARASRGPVYPVDEPGERRPR
jgi:biopolymer transport protein ExbB